MLTMTRKKETKQSTDRHRIKNFYSLRMSKEQQKAVADLARKEMRTKRAIILRALKKAFEEAGEPWPDDAHHDD